MSAVSASDQTYVDPSAVRDIVELACLAPSVHNTQPWIWRAFGNTLELSADPRRRLNAADTRGRNLAISCGAALHHAQVAARALGWEPTVSHLPTGGGSSLLARIELTPASPPPDATSVLQTIRDRCTDRRRFTSWPVPEQRLQHLAAAAADWGADALPVVDPSDRVRVERMVARAFDRQAEDERLAAEQLRWVDHSNRDGIPVEVIPESPSPEARLRTRYGTGLLADVDRELEGSDGLLIMRGGSDDIGAWLRTGEGLSALWLLAARDGLTVVPLSQAIELDETREALRVEVLHGLGYPHLLVRVGWQAISRGNLPRTPRRPVDEVLSS
jgi:hypothetical protein